MFLLLYDLRIALKSLHHLPHNAFVCLAGMVLSPGPVTKSERVAGVEELVDITNFQLRAKDGEANAWMKQRSIQCVGEYEPGTHNTGSAGTPHYSSMLLTGVSFVV